MFEQLRPFKKIMVTGPQRSGTTICARMIAHDLGLRYIDEDGVGWKSASVMDENALCRLFRLETGFVVQAPAAAHICHQFSAEDTAIVFMFRNINDIIASQTRIGWPYEDVELSKYGAAHGPIAQVKYEYWREVQKPQIIHPFEIHYKSLATHPLWVPKAERSNFKPRQYRRKQ